MSKVSNEKEENVLNPPQKPTAINKRHGSWLTARKASQPTSNPKIKLLVMFDRNVPKGKSLLIIFFENTAVKYLATLPKPPPKKTRNMFILSA